MSAPALPATIQGLLSPEAYPDAVANVELRQTHISYLLFAGDFVYKLKKPLDLGFLDFTTLEKRRRVCEQELVLNRRLCDETYLDVVPIVEADGGARVGGSGEPVEYAVKMRRLPDAGMMTGMLERDEVTLDHIAMLARRIAEFHGASERSDEIDSYGGLETAMVNWRENFEQTEAYIGRTITQQQFDEIRSYIEMVAQRDGPLFAQRVRDGRARDCHGDLRADAVCFVADGVCIFDCIEFNERFRYSDVAADIAFLAMDLEARGRRDLSDELMSRYLSATFDSTLPLVLGFYKCYRAYVRGKVDGFQLDQPEIAEAQRAAATEAAQRAFAQAHGYALLPAERALIIMVGLTGSGKSHLANGLAARIGAAVISSDVVRKRLLGIDPGEAREQPFETGIYAPEVTERVYTSLLEEARMWLDLGKPVVLDASYLQEAQRAPAARLADADGVRFLAVECVVEEAVARERLAARGEEPRGASDGRWEIYQGQAARSQSPDELRPAQRMVVDTNEPLVDQIDAVSEKLGF